MKDFFISGIKGVVYISLTGYPLFVIFLIVALPKAKACNSLILRKRFVIEIWKGVLCFVLSLVEYSVGRSHDFNNIIPVYIVVGVVITFFSFAVLPDVKTVITQKGKIREVNRRVEYGQG